MLACIFVHMSCNMYTRMKIIIAGLSVVTVNSVVCNEMAKEFNV